MFDEIRNNADNKDEIKKLKLLSKLPIPAKTKIDKISNEMCRRLTEDEEYAVKITLLTQILLEREDIYSDDLYKEMAKIIRQGQKEGDIVKGDTFYSEYLLGHESKTERL